MMSALRTADCWSCLATMVAKNCIRTSAIPMKLGGTHRLDSAACSPLLSSGVICGGLNDGVPIKKTGSREMTRAGIFRLANQQTVEKKTVCRLRAMRHTMVRSVWVSARNHVLLDTCQYLANGFAREFASRRSLIYTGVDGPGDTFGPVFQQPASSSPYSPSPAAYFHHR